MAKFWWETPNRNLTGSAEPVSNRDRLRRPHALTTYGYADRGSSCHLARGNMCHVTEQTQPQPLAERSPDELAAFLKARAIQTGIHYPIPTHRQPAVERFVAAPLPRTERLVEIGAADRQFAGAVAQIDVRKVAEASGVPPETITFSRTPTTPYRNSSIGRGSVQVSHSCSVMSRLPLRKGVHPGNTLRFQPRLEGFQVGANDGEVQQLIQALFLAHPVQPRRVIHECRIRQAVHHPWRSRHMQRSTTPQLRA